MLTNMGGFYDLNIIVERKNCDHLKNLIETLRTAYILGYDTVAVNTIVEVDSSSQKGKKKEKVEMIPPPLKISTEDVVKTEKIRHQKFNILQRLTIVFSDQTQTHQIQTSKIAKLYDIVAVQPENEQALRVCCTTLDIDVITFGMDVRSNVYPTAKQLGEALKRGIFFEVCYSPALVSNAARINTISNARRVISSCMKKNVIVSSQAKKPFDVRGPYDVVNLCYLFDVNSAQALDAVSTCPRRVILKAECRRSAKGVFNIISLSEKDRSKLRNCKNIEIIKTEDKIEDLPHSKRLKLE